MSRFHQKERCRIDNADVNQNAFLKVHRLSKTRKLLIFFGVHLSFYTNSSKCQDEGSEDGQLICCVEECNLPPPNYHKKYGNSAQDCFLYNPIYSEFYME